MSDTTERPVIGLATVLLLQAARRIERPGAWRQGPMRTGWGPWRRYCARGALEAAADYHGFDGYRMTDAEVALDAAARRRGFQDYFALNEHPATTQADVLSMFREAADLTTRPPPEAQPEPAGIEEVLS